MSRLKNLLPDAHNDFIFAVIGEEFGWVGYIMIIIFYFTIFFSVLHYIATKNKFFKENFHTKDELKKQEEFFLKKIIAVSILAVIFIAFTINSFVSLGLFPTKGMTLPFVSYGGSSILSHCIMIGVLMNVTKNENTNFRKLKLLR
jgi:cell division protein FtsW